MENDKFSEEWWERNRPKKRSAFGRLVIFLITPIVGVAIATLFSLIALFHALDRRKSRKQTYRAARQSKR